MAAEIDGSLFGDVNAGLYEGNAFRVSGLPVSATSRDIRRRSEQLRVMAQLGTDTATDTGQGVLLLAERPGATAIADALERLRDPSHRLVNEFFWFWPAESGGDDEAMAALRRGDADAAMSIWEGRSSGAGPEAAVAVHNMAVLAHVRALEKPGLSDRVKLLWQSAFRHWASVSASDTFWDLVTSRIREMADPRLTPATARQMRQALPSVLLSINAELAFRASREGRLLDAAAHVSLMSDSGFGAEAADRVLRQHAEPVLAQLRSISQDAERSAADPKHAVEAARQLLDQAQPLIRDVRLILSAEHPLVQGIKDDVASTVLRCAVRYVNETDDLQGGREVLTVAATVAATDAAGKRIRENLGIISTRITREEEQRRQVLLYSTCWFDKTSPASPTDAYAVEMRGDERRVRISAQTTRITWRTQTINVPRCAACRKAHTRRRRNIRIAGWSGLVVSIFLCVVSFTAGLKPLGVFFIFVSFLVFMMAVVLQAAPLMVREREAARDFDPVKALLASGWRPSG
jgi:hypothetical protein